MALIPDNWLKKAIKKASSKGLKNFLLKSGSVFVLPTEALISAITLGASSPVNANTFAAAASSFLNSTNHLGVSGVININNEKNKEGIATTPNIQRQSFSPPTPANK